MDDPRTCPGCESPMQGFVVRGVRVHRCQACGGLWFDFGELDQIAHRKIAEQPLGGATTRRCAFCRITLEPAVLPGGIPVETCGSCRGLYLDEGELEQLLGEARPPPAETSPPVVAEFVCVKCGGRFPMSQGNAIRSGLACGACTPQVQTTRRERWEANRQAGDGLDDSDAIDVAVDVLSLLL